MVPRQMVEINLILEAMNPDIDAGMVWRVMDGTICMLLFGYCGETWPWRLRPTGP